MRDGQIIAAINSGLSQLANNSNEIMARMGQEVEELRGYLTAETIRRETLEEMLFVKVVGGINKEAFEIEYNKKVAEHQEMVKKAVADEKAKEKNEPPKQESHLVSVTGAPLKSV